MHFKKDVGIHSAIFLLNSEWKTLTSNQSDNNLEKNIQLNIEAMKITDTAIIKQKKMMSEPAYLSYLVLDKILKLNKWNESDEPTAYFMGVGASGSSVADLDRIISTSLDSSCRFCEKKFATQGLASCSPLFTFQLMNNFTLCHGSILKKIQGPNAAIYSRGAGTVHALLEAAWAVSEGEVNRGFAGAADSSEHPITWSELQRQNELVKMNSTAAGLISLSSDLLDCFAKIEFVQFWGIGVDFSQIEQLIQELDINEIIIESHISQKINSKLFKLQVWESQFENLAAAPIELWFHALEKIKLKNISRVAVLNTGRDQSLGLVVFSALNSTVYRK